MVCPRLAAACAVGAIASGASAALYQIDVNGVVDFNVIGGNQSGIPSGSPVMMSFQVDSNVFVNSMLYPTRGYEVILPSFSLTVGGMPIIIDDPQSFGPAYFVLRDNDPAVDGFFLSPSIDIDFPVDVHVPGLVPMHELSYKVTYGGSTLSSLDIEDAVGFYDFTGLTVYNWGVGRFGNFGAAYAFENMTITPAPGAAGLAALGLLASRRRRR